MKNDKIVSSLSQMGDFLNQFLSAKPENFNEEESKFASLIKKSEIENSWFTEESVRFCLKSWAKNLTEEKISAWTGQYHFSSTPKKIGLILAGNIPLVGFHDVICVLLSGNIPLIKLSSKDRLILPFLLDKWNKLSGGILEFQFVEKLENYDAVIATGSNNTARYLEYYFKNDSPRITEIIISNGYMKSEETWKNNNRVKKLKLYVNGVPFGILNLKDSRTDQYFEMGTLGHNKNGTDLILKFEILKVYKGSKHNDTAITEIYFDGIDVH